MSAQQPNIEIDLCTLLFGACDANGHPLGDPMLARRHLVKLGLGRSAVDFLARAIWWWLRCGRRDFYKFNIPCPHPSYRDGDSWTEELGIAWATFRAARACVATKVHRGDRKKEILASDQITALVLYWTKSDNSTWYELNEPLLCQLLSQTLEVSVVMPGFPTRPTHTDRALPTSLARDGATAILDHPRPGKGYTPPQQSYPHSTSSPQTHHSIGDDGGATTDRERQMGATPYSSVQQTLKEEEEGKDGEFIRLIALGLEGEGVFPAPALQIARKAYQQGMDLDAVLTLFWTHKAHAASSKRVRDPVAAATQRLLSGELKPPRMSEKEAAAAEVRRCFFEEPDEPASGAPYEQERSDEVDASSTSSPSPQSSVLDDDPALSPETLYAQEETLPALAPTWWTGAKEVLQWQMQGSIYEQLIAPCTVQEAEDGTLLILAPDEGRAGRLQRWQKHIQRAIQSASGRHESISIVTGAS